MFDARLRPLINPPLRMLAAALYSLGARADAVTITGMGMATLAAAAIIHGMMGWALALVLLNRLLDGLDGPLSRLAPPSTQNPTRGGFLDAAADFYFYALIPLAFAVHDPSSNALAAACLLASFTLSAATFLAFAVAAKDRALTTTAQGQKSFYYLAGWMEGGETILFFIAMILLPAWFPVLAFIFAGLCFVGSIARLIHGYRYL
jgi:phosphatidylglycerophosphate synthase